MLKKEAAERVAKLIKLANGSTNSHEAASAKSQAEKLVLEHGLSNDDLMSGEMASAFDELVDSIPKIVASHPVLSQGLFDASAIVTDILAKIKAIDDLDKVKRLRQVANMVRTASFFAGNNPTIAEVKAILDSTLKNHGISL